MNAPWSQGRKTAASTREPFQAFVCDDATAEALKPIAAEIGWSAEKINKGGLRNAIQTLSVSASPNVLFVDMSESGDPLNDINALAEVCEPGTVVIASGLLNDVRLYRDLLASGIQDYLLKPLHPDQIREAFMSAQAMLMAPRQGAGEDMTHPRFSVAVVGVRGGVGASTIATSVAWLMGEKFGRSTALLDLDVHFGTGALAFDLEPGRGLTDAIENPSRIDGLFIERAIVKANDKLAILSAEAPMNQPMVADGTALFQLQDEMRGTFEAVVIDLPRGLMVQHPHLLSDTSAIIVVTELTLAGTRDTIRILSWLKSNAPGMKVIVVANRCASGGETEISKRDFEASIERKIDFSIALDAKMAVAAAKHGKCLAEAAINAKTGHALTVLTNAVLHNVDNQAEDGSFEGEGSKSLLGNFKTLLKAKTLVKKQK